MWNANSIGQVLNSGQENASFATVKSSLLWCSPSFGLFIYSRYCIFLWLQTISDILLINYNCYLMNFIYLFFVLFKAISFIILWLKRLGTSFIDEIDVFFIFYHCVTRINWVMSTKGSVVAHRTTEHVFSVFLIEIYETLKTCGELFDLQFKYNAKLVSLCAHSVN